MKVSYNWLCEYVDIDVTPEILADKLLNVGFEVEEIIYQNKAFSKVVIGEITSITKHENSDKLQICQVNVGSVHGDIIQIVTAATNVFEGALVPVALVGADLVGDIHIEKAKLRGEVSFGMFCSGQEVGITDADYPGASFDGILILKDDAKIGVDMIDYLNLTDVIFDISITANRPDCQSVLGVAREVAAVLSKEIKEPKYTYSCDDSLNINTLVKVNIEDNTNCLKYLSRIVTDIKMVETPAWMKKRLRDSNHNSHNIFVDITNYVLLELGQPMHAFDMALVEGNEINIRSAKKDEVLKLLNADDLKLSIDTLVIADSVKPMAVAGIMGGLNSGVFETTKTVAFESAKFARDKVRKTSKAIGVRSDASARFEKGVDVYTVEKAMDRALHLVELTGCGRIISGEINLGTEEIKSTSLTVPVVKINNVLGIDVPTDTINTILNNLGFNSTIENGILNCTIPSFRDDVHDYTDLAEEVIRFYGYDHIQGTLLTHASVTNGGFTKPQTYINELKNRMVENGYYEAITYSFTSPKYLKLLSMENNAQKNNPFKLLNPLGEELSVMRTTLIHSMFQVMSNNSKKNNPSASIFEIAKIYLKGNTVNPDLALEKETLCVGEYGSKSDFFTIKNVVEAVFETIDLDYSIVRSSSEHLHPGRSADVMVNNEIIGSFGEVHPDLINEYELPKRSLILEIDLEPILLQCGRIIKFKPISKYPAIERDLAFVLDDQIQMKQVIDIIKEESSDMLYSVSLFDIYKGDQIPSNKKSLAFTCKFSSLEKTLVDVEIESIVSNIICQVENKLGGKLR